MFCNYLYTWLIDRVVYCNKEVVDAKKRVELKEKKEDYIEQLIKKYWSLDRVEEEGEKLWDNKVLKGSWEELKEILYCLYGKLQKDVWKECAATVIAFFISWRILEALDEAWYEKMLEAIRKDLDFQDYLEDILIEGVKYVSRNERYLLSEWIKIIFELRWKRLPKLESRDRYEYREKFADEYLK